MTIDIEEIVSLATSGENDIEERVKALIRLKEGDYDKLYVGHSYRDKSDDDPFEVYAVDIDGRELTVYLSRTGPYRLRKIERALFERTYDTLDDHLSNRDSDTDARFHEPSRKFFVNEYDKSMAESLLIKRLLEQENPELRDLETYLTTYSI